MKIAYERLNGRPVFEVPIVTEQWGRRPRCPRSGWHAFFAVDGDRCIVVPSKTAETYLRQRKYARLIGTAVFSVDGIDHGKHPLTVALLETAAERNTEND